ncbi:MAG: AraC family transcriptional regulator [Lachnospiraceae bacterium]|nr:AraC family transcriptional regulator [Lachnospiraceae bacterium]
MLKEIDSDNIYSRHARDEREDGRDYVMHIHDRCEIYYFVDGTASYLVEGSEYPLKPGSLLIMGPGEVHRARIDKTGPYERYAINFPIDLFDDIDPERIITRPMTERGLGKDNLYFRPEYRRLFEKVCDEKVGSDDRYVYIYSCIMSLLLDIGEEFGNRRKPRRGKNKTLSGSIIEYVNDNLSEELSVGSVAEHFYISESQLTRIFREYIGAAPWEYITAKRLMYAKSLIADGHNAGEAALMSGFGDYSSFYRAYVKRFGTSPARSRDD